MQGMLLLRMLISIRICLAAFCLLAYARLAGGAELDWGPLLSRDEAPSGEARWRALGPLLEFRTGTNGYRLAAVRPLFSREYDVSQRKTAQDVLWPVWTGKQWHNAATQTQWRCLLLMSWRNDDVQDPGARYSFRVLPFYFQGRDDAGRPYWALFPLGGTIRDFLFYDEVRFWLFPLYGRTRVDDLQGWFALWPVMTRAWNDEVERHRVFPFYGYSKRRDDFEKYFVLWPIWNHARYGYAGASGTGYVLFPLFGRVQLEDQESWMFLPPFFRFSRGAHFNQVYSPWPFIQISRGEVDQTYFWPLWGRKTAKGYEHGFMVWPVCMRTRQFSPRNDRQRSWVLPFVYFTDERQGLPAPETTRRVRKIWPLFTWHKQNDHSRLRVPTLLPFKDWEAIDRNYAPIWTLYSREATADTMEQEALWGIFRHRRGADGSRRYALFPLARFASRPSAGALEWSFLQGAVGYSRVAGQRRLRLLYFIKLPLGGTDADD